MTQQTRFAEVFCSQCGQSQGPGDHGYSHCDDHPGWKHDRKLARRVAAKKAAETRAFNRHCDRLAEIGIALKGH